MLDSRDFYQIDKILINLSSSDLSVSITFPNLQRYIQTIVNYFNEALK